MSYISFNSHLNKQDLFDEHNRVPGVFKKFLFVLFVFPNTKLELRATGSYRFENIPFPT